MQEKLVRGYMQVYFHYGGRAVFPHATAHVASSLPHHEGPFWARHPCARLGGASHGNHTEVARTARCEAPWELQAAFLPGLSVLPTVS